MFKLHNNKGSNQVHVHVQLWSLLHTFSQGLISVVCILSMIDVG